jgi:hypothetical protein
MYRHGTGLVGTDGDGAGEEQPPREGFLANIVPRLAENPPSKIVGGGTPTVLEMNMDTYTDRLERVHHAAVGASTAG